MGENCSIRFSEYETDERGSLGHVPSRRGADEGTVRALPRSKKRRIRCESIPNVFLGTAKWFSKAKPWKNNPGGRVVQVPPPQPKRKPSIRMVFLFGKKRTLRCMKHEVALRAMKRACGTLRANSASLRHEVAQHHFERQRKTSYRRSRYIITLQGVTSLCKADVFLPFHSSLIFVGEFFWK